MVCEHHALGGAGAVGLARAVEAACAAPREFKYLYSLELPIKDKIAAIATGMYAASGKRLHYTGLGIGIGWLRPSQTCKGAA